MKSFILFFFLIHSVRITDFDNYLSFVPNCTSLHHVFLKGFLHRLIQKMLLSVFIIQTGQGVTHVQNIACTYDTFFLISNIRTLRIEFYVESFASRGGASPENI